MTMRLHSLAFAAPLLVALSFSPADAATPVVNVELNNQTITTDLPTNLGMAMPGMSKAVMTVRATPSVIPAGEISFVATNKSADFVHEMILLKVTDPAKPLPYVAADTKVDEDAAGHLGEVAELDPGKSGTLTIKLDPGTYMLLCNVAGHYMAGMWTTVVVK
jgi:uncharacterized cupredoxin-like copper-binding protein